MTRCCLVAWLTLLSLVLLVPIPSAGQTRIATADEWIPPRTPDGQPDISGIFTFRTLTPLSRPAALEGKATLSPEEAAAFEASERERLNRDLFDPETGQPSAGYQPRSEGGVLSYNEFWYERGVELTRDKRTSLVVDPPDGRVPYTAAYRKQSRVQPAKSRGTALPIRTRTEACRTGASWGSTRVPRWCRAPTTTTSRSCRLPGYVAIVNEMVHNARIVPLDGRPHGNMRQWAGDSRGHWEGDTLVVETVNFLRETSLGGSTADMHLVERFRRIRCRHGDLRVHRGGSALVHAAVDRDDAAQANRWDALRVRLSRRQYRAVRHLGGCAQQGHAAGRGCAVETQIAFSCPLITSGAM